ncbi:hypothetical protein [Leifsonia poae]|uniref:hypothetical protein n=1 Tax=Leifsonia poae TaxID=110933 RepID=UPI003D664FD9
MQQRSATPAPSGRRDGGTSAHPVRRIAAGLAIATATALGFATLTVSPALAATPTNTIAEVQGTGDVSP